MFDQIKNSLQRNFQKKFIALIVAVALWFFVMGSQDPVIDGSFTVPVSVMNVSSTFRAIYNEQETTVSVNAPRSYFAMYNASDIRAFVNVANYPAGEHDIPIEVSFPKGFELEKEVPDTMHVMLDPFSEVQFPVDIITSGSPAMNHYIMDMKKSAENVTLIGSKTSLDEVKRVIGYVSLAGNVKDFEISVPLSAIDENGREVRHVRVVPSVINVNVNIEEGKQEKFVTVVADVTTPNDAKIEKLEINPEVVKITARQNVISSVNSIKTEPIILAEGQIKFFGKVKIILPDEVTSETEEVEVTVEAKK